MSEITLLNQKQACEKIGLDPKTFRELVSHGDITFIPVKKSKRFTIADLEQFIEEKRKRECPSTNPKTPHTGTTISKSLENDFMALRIERQRKKPRISKPKNG